LVTACSAEEVRLPVPQRLPLQGRLLPQNIPQKPWLDAYVPGTTAVHAGKSSRGVGLRSLQRNIII